MVQPFKIISNKQNPSPLEMQDGNKTKSKSVLATAHTIASLNALANAARQSEFDKPKFPSIMEEKNVSNIDLNSELNQDICSSRLSSNLPAAKNGYASAVLHKEDKSQTGKSFMVPEALSQEMQLRL